MDKIDLTQYPSNSNKMKEEMQKEQELMQEKKSYNKVKERSKKVVKGEVHSKKKSPIRIAAEAFLLKDLGMIKDHMWIDVVKPNLRVTSSDILHGLVDILFGSESVGRKKSGERYAYDKVSWRGNTSSEKVESVRPKRTLDIDELLFDSREDVQYVIRELEDRIDMYKEASVYDLYDAIGKTADYTYQKYGWYDISDATITRARGGRWLLRMPKPVHLK